MVNFGNHQAWVFGSFVGQAFAVAIFLGLLSYYLKVASHHAEAFTSYQVLPLHEEVFHSPDVFRVHYEEMEERLKVYMYDYEETLRCVLRTPWSEVESRSQDLFFLEIIFSNSRLVTHNPEEADLFFIPLPCVKPSGKVEPQVLNLTKYVYNYPHWNITLGADHFYTTCHGIRAIPAEHTQFLAKNSIRVGCSASYNDSQHIPNKDVVVPHLLLQFFAVYGSNTDIELEGRTKLGYWFGRPDLNLTSQLASEWNNDTELVGDIRDPDVFVDEHFDLYEFYSNKYCICHHRDYVESNWIGLAIHYACVPVILSDYFVLPFNDILDWSKFSVILKEADVLRVKEILEGIPISMYKELYANLVEVQRHFHWNFTPMKYDAFHMLMYQLWLRRQMIRS